MFWFVRRRGKNAGAKNSSSNQVRKLMREQCSLKHGKAKFSASRTKFGAHCLPFGGVKADSTDKRLQEGDCPQHTTQHLIA